MALSSALINVLISGAGSTWIETRPLMLEWTSPLSSPHAKVEAALLPDSTVSLWICKHLIVIRSSGGRQIAFLFKYMTMKRERERERGREGKRERERSYLPLKFI